MSFSHDSKICDISAKVKTGERFIVDVPEPEPAEPAAQARDLDILYEDTDLLVLNKPAGLVVHPAPGNPDHTLVNALLAHCGDSLSGIGGVRRPGIVHRLDKNTSGVMVVAKNDATHQGLSKLFAAHDRSRFDIHVFYAHPDYTEYTDFDDAYCQIEHWLKVEYMTERIHSALGYLTPAEFEAAHHRTVNLLMSA